MGGAVTAEAIAKVVADLRAGRFRSPRTGEEIARWGAALLGSGPIVDATAIYEGLVAKDTPVAVYEDHPCVAPPWDRAMVAYVNGHGNVIVMGLSAAETHGESLPPGVWDTAEPIDWSEVRWIMTVVVYLGGRSETLGPIQTTGPMHIWRVAVYADGRPADINWVHLVPDCPMEQWDTAQLTLLGALNFLGCRNVDIAEPARPRAEARRVARTGVTVSEIVVFPAGRSTKRSGEQRGIPVGAARLTKVRGHFAHYGPDYGKGLLFGKYAGRFWHPAHAYGDETLGESSHDYKLVAP